MARRKLPDSRRPAQPSTISPQARRLRPRCIPAGASITPAVCNSLSRAARAPCRSRVTPSRDFPAVGKVGQPRCFGQNGGGELGGGITRRCHARPRSVSLPVVRSWKLLCAA